MDSKTEPKTIILIETNLFFSTALSGNLKRLGYGVEVEKSWEGVRAKISVVEKSGLDQSGGALKAGGSIRAVIINLAAPGLDAAAIIKNLKSHPETSSIPVIGFGGHQDKARLEAAAAAGCDQVVTNGVISSSLEAVLRRIP